jgi:hypothetical protein
MDTFSTNCEFRFTWKDSKSKSLNMLEMHNCTLEHAKQVARDKGWRDYVWWNPNTWSSHYSARYIDHKY